MLEVASRQGLDENIDAGGFGGIDVSLSGVDGYGIGVQSFGRTMDFLFCCCVFRQGALTNIQVVLAIVPSTNPIGRESIFFGGGSNHCLEMSVS